MNEPKGKTVLITGASGAIGKAIAREFFLHGYNLILVGRNTERLENIREELYNPSSLSFPHPSQGALKDVPSEDGGFPQDSHRVMITYYDAKEGRERELIDNVTREHGPIDILVNGAGMGYYESLEDLDDKITKDVFEVNFFAPIRLTQAFLQQGKRPLWIINILSISAKLPVPFSGIYASSKAALYMEMESARGELDQDVKIINILPGRIESAFSKNAPGTKYFSHGGRRASPKGLAKVVYNAFLKEKGCVIWPPKYRYILYIQRLFPNLYIKKMKDLKERYGDKK